MEKSAKCAHWLGDITTPVATLRRAACFVSGPQAPQESQHADEAHGVEACGGCGLDVGLRREEASGRDLVLWPGHPFSWGRGGREEGCLIYGLFGLPPPPSLPPSPHDFRPQPRWQSQPNKATRFPSLPVGSVKGKSERL